MNYLWMWFVLSNVVCNGIPCYLESGSASAAASENRDRVFGVWAQIQPLAHIIHAPPRRTALERPVSA